jgi:hypothetical protein
MGTRGEDGTARLMEKLVDPRRRHSAEALASEARLRALDQKYAPFLMLLGQLVTAYGGTAERLASQLTPKADGIPVWWLAVPNGRERWLAAARTLTPGLYLKAMVLQDKNADSRRRPKPSDNADGFHVAEIPYVDVITLDRENLALVNRYTRDLPTVRRAALVQNGDVEALIRAIAGSRA